MNGRKLLVALAISVFSYTLFSSRTIQAQESAPPKESTATLEKTLSWLDRHFGTNFSYGYSTMETSAGTSTASHYDVEVKRVTGRFADCNLSWRDREDEIAVSLSDLDPLSSVVLPHTEPNTKFDSEVWKIDLVTRDHRKSVTVQQAVGVVQTRSSIVLLYDDKETANRLARALQHAIKLCSQQAPPAHN